MNKERDVYYFYYDEDEQKNICLKEGTKKIIKLTRQERCKIDAKFFEVNSNYEAKEESLFEYEKQFNRCADEIKKYTNNFTDYKKWLNDGLSIINYFKSKSTKALKEANIENINVDELILSEKCNNGGILYLDSDYKAKELKCYGYDFTNCYGTFLSKPNISKLKIPTKCGKYAKIAINILKADKLPFGYYMLKIQSSDPLIQSYFKFSTDNTYCHYSLINLQIILQHLLKDKKNELDKLVSIEICGDAYIYDEANLIDCDKIFGHWFVNVSNLKNDLPNNFLVKNLSTKLWGYLSQYQRIYVEEDDIENYDKALYYRFSQEEKFDYLCIGIENPTKANSKYVLVKTDNAYKQNGIARLKSFLIASVRLYMTRLIIDNDLVDNVVRLCTDGIVLNKRHDFTKNKLYEYVPVIEKKTTGLIKFYHANKYNHCCKYCDDEWKYKKSYIHECAK